jgi:phosphoribosyl 1,2-cyclic phosphate phosphodiesterase
MLGSGTSTGVPVIGCTCAVCTSDDPRNRRLRTGLWIETDRASILVDASADLRQQALRFGVARVDAVLFTHAHADHIYGLDDLRAFNFRQGEPIPCFGPAAALEAIRGAFAYIFDGHAPEGGGKPQLVMVPVRERFDLLDAEVVPVPVWHGTMEVFGYRIGGLAYVTDCKRIPDASLRLLEGVEVLILDALRYRPHPTHLSISEAVETAARIGARRTVLTHICHDIDHAAPLVALPQEIELGYDGLAFEVE